MTAKNPFEVKSVGNAKQGRSVVLLHEVESYSVLVNTLQEQLATQYKTFTITSPKLDRAEKEAYCEGHLTDWLTLDRYFAESLESCQVRQVTLIAFGPTTALAQSQYHRLPRSVRGLVLIDPSCRPNQSATEILLAKLERYLPMGLPFRSAAIGFDGMPLLHRVRCPVLLVVTNSANQLQREQAELMSVRIPTAWLIDLRSSTTISEAIPPHSKLDGDSASLTSLANPSSLDLSRIISQFMDLPAKCSQKSSGVQPATKA